MYEISIFFPAKFSHDPSHMRLRERILCAHYIATAHQEVEKIASIITVSFSWREKNGCIFFPTKLWRDSCGSLISTLLAGILLLTKRERERVNIGRGPLLPYSTSFPYSNPLHPSLFKRRRKMETTAGLFFYIFLCVFKDHRDARGFPISDSSQTNKNAALWSFQFCLVAWWNSAYMDVDNGFFCFPLFFFSLNIYLYHCTTDINRNVVSGSVSL